MPSPFIWYANYYSTVNNEREAGIFMQIPNFSKIRSKFLEKYLFENIASYSSRECQTLSSDMRIIILLLIMKEEQAFFMQIRNFSKIQSKIFENYFSENIASFSCRGCQTFSSDIRIIFLLSIMKEWAIFVSVTNGRTYTFLKFPQHTDSNGIAHSVVA